MKTRLFLILIVVVALQSLWAQDRFNPPFPRVAVYSMGDTHWPTYSVGTRLQKLSQYDMVLIPASEDKHGSVRAQALRNLNPDQIIVGMGPNGVWFYDPPQYYLYRAYRGTVMQPVEPNDPYIVVDSAEGIAQGLNGDYRFCFAVINNDVINVQYATGDTLVVNADGGFYSVNESIAVGDTVLSPLRLSGPGVFPNFSQWSPSVDGKHVWNYMAEDVVQNEIAWDSGLYDGIFHDAVYANVYLQDFSMDMNLNRVDDYLEFGSTPAKAGRYFINPHRREYIDLWLEEELQLMEDGQPGETYMLGVNTGGTTPYFYDRLNGHLYEGFLRWANWYYLKDDCLEWRDQNAAYSRPSMMFICDYIPEKWADNGKDRFTKMRFGLTTSLLFDTYYGLEFGDWYYIMLWYDEFETNLGYGIGDPVELANGAWVRYFDHGAALCNPTGSPQTVLPSDLDGRTYYRLRGGQDPVTNNGEMIDGAIELYGHTYGSDLRGDGLLLFTEPTTAVADVIVDNFYHNDTSPGSQPVELTGGWSRHVSAGFLDLSRNNPYWSQYGNKSQVGDFDDAWGYHAIAPGDGSATATWRPTIGVPGYYEISEWHGWHGDTETTSSEATNVPFEIVVDSESHIRGTIDQSTEYGQWNRLGYAWLPAGTSSYVRITNAANGVVLADAVRFRYLGDDVQPDTDPPQPPSNVRIDVQND